MPKTIKGKVYFVGADVNTDEIIPARHCTTTDLDTMGDHALEDLHESKNIHNVPFAKGEFKILVADENFGCGSSREVAPVALKKAGIEAVIAPSFARIFNRNSINMGLPISTNISLVPEGLKSGDEFEVELNDDFYSGYSPIHRQITETGGLTAFNQSDTKFDQLSAPERPMTLAEKILAKASGVDYVEPGMTVYADVDRVITHELTLPVAAEQLYRAYGDGFKVKDKEKILFVADHTIQIPLVRDDWNSQQMVQKASVFIEEQELPNAFLPPAPFMSQGICHVLFPEKGLIRPDTLVVGTDSHTCTHGAYGCYAFGIGNTDLTEIMASGRLLVDVPETIKVEVHGKMQPGVYAKDVILYILSEVTMNGFTNCVVEFSGEGLAYLSAEDRSTIANMTVEGGANCGIFPVGELRSDSDAIYKQEMSFDIWELVPYVAKPFQPDNGVPITELNGKIDIDVSWVGSCTGGKLEDVHAAAEIIQGHRVIAGNKFIVSPSTMGVWEEAGRHGYSRWLLEAGAEMFPPSCGACIAMGPGTLREEQVGVFSSNRNFKGRSGLGSVYLASPATCAASAITGKITDPREYLS